MKKLILLSLFFIFGCSHTVKSVWGTPIGEIKMKGITESDCEVECKVFEYDDNFIELLDGYEHPWCICISLGFHPTFDAIFLMSSTFSSTVFVCG